MDVGSNNAVIFSLCVLVSLATAGIPWRAAEQAKRIHDRLTGVPASNAMLDAMENAITAGGGATQAALYAIDGALPWPPPAISIR